MDTNNVGKIKTPFAYAGLSIFIILFILPVSFTFLGTSFDNFLTVFSNIYFVRIILFTFSQAFVSTAFALLIGFPAAYLMARCRFKGKKIFTTLYSVCFILPPILVVLGFVVFYGNSGYLNRFIMFLFNIKEGPLKILYSYKAVILSHAFYNFPVIAYTIGGFWSTLSQEEEESARTEGANELQIFYYITFPRIKSAVISACSLVFLYCFTSFTIILVLGGDPSLTTIEVEIYRQARISMNTGLSCALSIVSIVCVSAVLFLQINAEQKNMKSEESLYARKAYKKADLPQILYLVVTSLFIMLPILGIFLKSFSSNASAQGKTGFSLNAYRTAFSNFSAFTNSIFTATASSVLGIFTALSFCYLIVSLEKKNIRSQKISKLLNTIVMFPMSVSSVILSLGYILISGIFGSVHPFILPLIHSIIILPFAVRSILPAYRALPPVFAEDARIQGASEVAIFFKVHLPLLKNVVANSLAFGFAISMGELNSTIILGLNSFPTINGSIYALINKYNYQAACALGTILIAICCVVFGIKNMTIEKENFH